MTGRDGQYAVTFRRKTGPFVTRISTSAQPIASDREIACDSRLSHSRIKALGKINNPNEHVKLPSVHNSYAETGNYFKTKGGSPAWARTTITITYAESVACRVSNGLKCRIGLEKPSLVHNSYTDIAFSFTTGLAVVGCLRF